MSLKEVVDAQREGMRALSTNGVIGLHLVSGPIVGFAIGYWLDASLGTGPWLKLAFFIIGILAGFLNVWRDSRALIRKMDNDASRK